MIEFIDNIGIQLFLGSGSAFLDGLALFFTNAFTWVPLYISLLYLIIKNNDNMQQIFICFGFAVLCIAISSTAANVVAKPMVERLRPCNDPTVMYLADIAGNLRNKDFSFFSSHAANTMSLAVFFSLLTRSGMLSIAMVSWSLLNCWTRLYLGQHFLTDILTGLAWGIVTGICCYLLCRKAIHRIIGRQNFISSQYTSTGYAYLDIDVVLSVLFLIVVIGIII